MAKLDYSGPGGEVASESVIDLLREVLLDSSVSYWHQGAGDAMVDYLGVEGEFRLLIVLHDELGFYLQWIGLTNGRAGETLLSAGDPEWLHELAKTKKEGNERFCMLDGMTAQIQLAFGILLTIAFSTANRSK